MTDVPMVGRVAAVTGSSVAPVADNLYARAAAGLPLDGDSTLFSHLLTQALPDRQDEDEKEES